MLVGSSAKVDAAQSCIYANTAQAQTSCLPFYGDGMTGTPAKTFLASFGMNTHFAYSGYQSNFTYYQHVLTALGVKHIRDDGFATISTGSTTLNEMTTLAGLGMKFDLILNPPTTSANITSVYNAMPPNSVEAFENYNEYAGSSPTAPDTLVAEQKMMYPAIKALNPSINVYGPSLANIPDFPLFGTDLSPYEDFSVTHDYTGEYPPETPGWYGISQAGFQQNALGLWKFAAKWLAASKPVVSSENGECTNNTSAIGVNVCVSTLEQFTYGLRHWIALWNLGYPINYFYSLAEYQAGDDYSWGLINSDGSQKPALAAFNGFFTIMADAATLPGACILPVKSVSTNVSSIGFCKSNGAYELLLWQPAMSYNPSTNQSITVSPVTATVTYSNEFTTTRLRTWTYAPATGAWSNATASGTTSTSVSVSDRVTILEINGPVTPVTITALPTS